MSAAPLSLERIVDEAIALVDAGGPAELSMRKLAASLGTSTMSTYHHVADKHALVEAIAERVMGELASPDPDVGWDEALRTMSSSFRELTRRHHHVFELLLAGPRPDALTRTVSGVVELLVRSGFDREGAVATLRIFVRYLLGVALVEAASPASAADLDAGFDADIQTLLEGVRSGRR